MIPHTSHCWGHFGFSVQIYASPYTIYKIWHALIGKSPLGWPFWILRCISDLNCENSKIWNTPSGIKLHLPPKNDFKIWARYSSFFYTTAPSPFIFSHCQFYHTRSMSECYLLFVDSWSLPIHCQSTGMTYILLPGSHSCSLLSDCS